MIILRPEAMLRQQIPNPKLTDCVSLNWKNYVSFGLILRKSMLIYVSECINTFSMQKMSEYIFQKQNLFFGSFQSLKDSIFQITYLSNSLKCQNMYFKINIFVFRFLPNHQGLNLPNSKPSKTVHICIYRSQDLFAAITKLGITCQRRL